MFLQSDLVWGRWKESTGDSRQIVPRVIPSADHDDHHHDYDEDDDEDDVFNLPADEDHDGNDEYENYIGATGDDNDNPCCISFFGWVSE